MNNLFRKEVLDRHAGRHLGSVFLSAPLSFWAITLLIGGLMTGFFLFAVFGGYARKERVRGFLIPTQGLVQIHPKASGVYRDIFFEMGDAVTQGDALFTIETVHNLSDGENLTETLLASMMLEQEAVRDKLETLHTKYQLTDQRLIDEKSALTMQAQQLDTDIDIQKRTVELEDNIWRKMSTLIADDAASDLEVSSQEQRLLAARQRLGSLIREQAHLNAQIKDITSQIALLPIQQGDERHALSRELAELEQKISRTKAGALDIVHAPITGTIAASPIRPGQYSQPDKMAVSILPKGSSLQAELYVPTHAAGFIQPGQSVRLLYDAFPYQKFGSFAGTIADISRTVVNPRDLVFSPATNEPVFLVHVTLEPQSLEHPTDALKLQAGMTLSADIILEERKIWEWAFEPLLGASR